MEFLRDNVYTGDKNAEARRHLDLAINSEQMSFKEIAQLNKNNPTDEEIKFDLENLNNLEFVLYDENEEEN